MTAALGVRVVVIEGLSDPTGAHGAPPRAIGLRALCGQELQMCGNSSYDDKFTHRYRYRCLFTEMFPERRPRINSQFTPQMDAPTIEAPASASSAWLEHALARAANGSTPVVIALGTDHALLPQWTPTALALRVPTLSKVYVSTDFIFGPYYDESRPFARLGLVPGPSHNYSEATMHTRDVFASQGGATYTYTYYSGEVERDLSLPLRESIRPLERALIARNPRHASVNLWLGASPVVAPCHYDAYHNAVVQIYGRKRWLLAPPTAWAHLRPYPFLHPCHAQCQQPLGTLSTGAREAVGARSVELRRGDVLYVPPLYFHETEARSAEGTIAINGWVGCEESNAAAAIFELPRPPGSASAALAPEAAPEAGVPTARSNRIMSATAKGQPTAAAAAESEFAATLVLALSQRTFGSAWQLAEHVWSERYQSLVSEGTLAVDEAVPSALDCKTLQDSPVLSAAVVDAHGGGDARHGEVLVWAERAARLAHAHLSDGTRSTWLANLAELVAAERISMRGVGRFWRDLQRCSPRGGEIA